MNDWIERIDKLDLSLFLAIPSQTNDGDRRSLLAVQRATAKKYNKYAYLEIGSHLGGSIQPYLFDDRCKRIYSIDPRPSQQPDDRSPGHIAFYDNNSSEQMLSMLDKIGYGEVAKIQCFDLDASKVDPGNIKERPQIIFIDGEHTKSAVLSDYQFCRKVVSKNGTIMFHDFGIIYPALLQICALLDKQKQKYVALLLEGSVFAIFFDTDLIRADPYLASLRRRNRALWFRFHVKRWLKKYLPYPLLELLRKLRSMFTKKSAEQGAAADG